MNEPMRLTKRELKKLLEFPSTNRKPKRQMRLHGCGCVSDMAGNRFYTLCYYHEKEVLHG